MNQTSRIEDLETELYKQLCEDWKEALIVLKEQEALVEGLRQKVIEKSGGERMEYGVKVSLVSSKGRTNYKAIVEEMNAPKELIEKHTGMPETTWRVTKY